MNSYNLKIRKATKQDLGIFNKFSDQESIATYCAAQEYFYCEPNLRWIKDDFNKILKSTKNFVCVAVLGNEVVGIVFAKKKVDDEGYLCRDTKYADMHTFWIDSSENNNKDEIASALLHEVEKWVKTQNIIEIRSLEFVQPNMNKEYYKQANFQIRNVGVFKDLH